MASDLNVVLITGRLATEPELRFTSRGIAAAALRLASTRYWKTPDSPEGEFRKQNVFITVETYGKTAERVAGSRHKGDGLMIRGRLVYEEWTDAKGEKRRAIKLMSDDVSFIPSTRPVAGAAAGDAATDSEEDTPPDAEAHEGESPDADPAATLPQGKTARENARIRH